MDCELQFLITLVISEMKTTTLLLFLMITMSVYAQSAKPSVSAEKADAEKFLGRWYDIASYPAGSMKDCRCTTLDLELLPDRNSIQITNRCVKFRNGKSRLSVTRGKADVIEDSANTRLSVHAIWLFRKDFQIIGRADDYSWAVIAYNDFNVFFVKGDVKMKSG